MNRPGVQNSPGLDLGPYSSLMSWAALDKSFTPLSLLCEVGRQHLPLRVPGTHAVFNSQTLHGAFSDLPGQVPEFQPLS